MSALTKLARGRACQVRLPGICNFNAETTVLAHYRLAGICGVGFKPVSYTHLIGELCKRALRVQAFGRGVCLALLGQSKILTQARRG